ncbi:hypothetical protein, partial [Cellulosimicrobium funkei]
PSRRDSGDPERRRDRGAVLTAATGSGAAEGCAAGAALLVVTSLAVLGSTQVRAARRAPAG